jgi:4-hydroxy-tetrahydrodipicolinate reductase
MTQRIAVIGAAGRLGSVIASGIAASDDLELVAAVTPSQAGRRLGDVVPGLAEAGSAGDLVITADLEELLEAGVDVAVEVTGPKTVGVHLRWLLENDVHAVVGASGLSDDDLEAARALAAAGPARALIAPNFSIGAVLVERFAAEAARHLPHVEIIELHHDRKVDAPSGTALATAAAVARARGDDAPGPAGVDGESVAPGSRGSLHHGIPIHAIRLPGLLAHEEVLLGGEGQLLTLRHDTSDRSAFVSGALLACRRVAALDGLVVGLGALLGDDH